jgi:hypothetical protein
MLFAVTLFQHYGDEVLCMRRGRGGRLLSVMAAWSSILPYFIGEVLQQRRAHGFGRLFVTRRDF